MMMMKIYRTRFDVHPEQVSHSVRRVRLEALLARRVLEEGRHAVRALRKEPDKETHNIIIESLTSEFLQRNLINPKDTCNTVVKATSLSDAKVVLP